MPSDGIFGDDIRISGGARGNVRHSAKPPIAADAAFRAAPLCRFPTYPICSEHIYEKEKNTAAGNLFGGFVCLYGDGGTPTPGK
ncbi:TPA: hypothetical protein WI610_000103 [Neisseria meningitidis]|nr:hypothetical protein [Neisseria meningitidis]MBG9207125.1 hypothetical protein [Neisseria meningitidis]MBH2373720.1 hypothetical protein [Neisseria meningitidis]MBH2502067.1 hypothetical protein [Neisseria meningitidis]MBH6074095.1 hypothetical protein [Neisseria meningitidis]